MQINPEFLVVDLFCGAGGTSLGFDRAEYEGQKIAQVIACVNHDALAILNHSINFPSCVHFTEDVRSMDLDALNKIVVEHRAKYPNAKLILWASLECTHFSNAKTGSRDADSRTLAWVLYDYIPKLNPDLVMIENVREFMSWGPLMAKVVKSKTGDYCPLVFDKKTNQLTGNFVPENRKRGADYVKWRQTIEGMGYRYKSKLLNSADFGSYQSRLRYFAVFAKPEMPISFPAHTHCKKGQNGLPKWKAVREILDLHEVGNSIFKRKKQLSPNTLRRILAGLLKFVANGQQSYLVKNYGGNPAEKVVSLESPHPTVTTIPHEMLISTDFLCQYNGNASNCNFPTDGPCRTQTTRDRFAFIRAAWIDSQFGHDGQMRGASSLDQPSPTLTTVPKKNLVSAEFLMPTNYNNEPTDLDCPAPTVTANRKWHYLVSAKAHHYLLNPQFKSAGGSVDDPCFTLIAKMDKRPPSLVTVELDHGDETKTFGVDNSFFQDEAVDVETRIRVFMECYGIREIYMRMLNIPELKRIQGLDMAGQRDYILEGPKDQQKKHIGNAVEPRVVTAWIEGYYNEIKSVGKADQLKLIYA